MKYLIWVIIVAVIIGIVLYAYETNKTPQATPPTSTSTTYTVPITNTESAGPNVIISNYSFSESEIKVKKGTTVTWTNDDNAKHSIVSDSGSELKSEMLDKGMEYSHTFNTAGTFNYHCSPHTSMKGSVIVEE